MLTHDVVAAIIVEGGTVFAAERGYGSYKGYWEFPGGKIEPGETPEQALSREIAEELDCAVDIERLFCEIAHDYPEYRVRMRCYLCKLAGAQPTLLEHSDARWLGRDDIDGVRWLESDWAIVDKLKNEGIVSQIHALGEQS